MWFASCGICSSERSEPVYTAPLILILLYLSKGLELAERIPSGIVHINDQTINNEAVAPFGDVGASGMGRRQFLSPAPRVLREALSWEHAPRVPHAKRLPSLPQTLTAHQPQPRAWGCGRASSSTQRSRRPKRAPTPSRSVHTRS
jgi:hypothetical protein